MNFYACVAGVEPPAKDLPAYRCRKKASNPPESMVCKDHLRNWSGASVLAPAPDVIYLKLTFPSSPNWRQDMDELGFHIATRDVKKTAELDARHTAHAEAFGRNADAPRKGFRPDSGVQVFGSEGLRDVSLQTLDGELIGAGYEMTGAHVIDRSFEGALVLVLQYANATARARINGSQPRVPGRAHGFIRMQLHKSWGAVHIWANPPSLDEKTRGQIVHTINAGVGKDDLPVSFVVFHGGHWWIKTASY